MLEHRGSFLRACAGVNYDEKWVFREYALLTSVYLEFPWQYKKQLAGGVFDVIKT